MFIIIPYFLLINKLVNILKDRFHIMRLLHRAAIE